MKYLIKKIALISLLSVGLAACGHQNPLTSPNKRKVVTALVNSSQYAELKMKLNTISPGGYVYSECMDHQSKVDCKSLYRWMLKDLRNQQGFEHVTLRDLTNQALWDTTAEEYAAVQFDAIDRQE